MGAFDKLGEVLDRTIAIFSPESYQRRLSYRTAAMHQQRFYEGATKGRRADSWRKADSAEKEPHGQLYTLRQRGRDATRNNGYGKKGVGGIVSNTIGTGIVLQYRSSSTKKKEEKANRIWKQWHDTTACDFNGMMTGPALQALCFRTMVNSGEVFIRKRNTDPAKSKIPLKLQVLSAEFLNESIHGTYDVTKNRVLRGIEFDADDVRVAYHFFKTHPGSDNPTTDSVRIPAEEVIHLYRKDDPDQQRGVPWLHAILLKLKDLDSFEDAELVRRKISACFAGFVSRGEVESQAPINGMNSASTDLPPLVDRLEPGILEHLGPGEEITFATPPNVTGYQEYVTAILHKIAAGLEIPYSVLTGDYSLVNFSSGRMGWLEFQRVIEQWRWNIFIPMFMEPIKSWFEEIAKLTGARLSDLDYEWTAPRREMIDPMKEISATLLQVKAGLITMQEAIKELGYDPSSNVDGIQAWNKLIDAAGITLDSDPRKDPKRMLAENVAEANKMKDNLDKQSGDKNAD